MSLTRMDNISDSARFLDNVDLTFSLDSRSTTSQQLTSIEIGAKPIVFRASYHDINLIMNITNKALDMYGNTANARAQKPEPGAKSTVDFATAEPSALAVTAQATSHPVASARVITSKEQVKGSHHLSWTPLTIGSAQSNVRGAEDRAHRGCPRTADATLEDKPVQHCHQRLVWRCSLSSLLMPGSRTNSTCHSYTRQLPWRHTSATGT